MENVVWTMEICPICEEVKEKLKNNGVEFVEKSCKDLVNGNETNMKAVRRFVKQKHTAPVILIGGEFKDAQEI